MCTKCFGNIAFTKLKTFSSSFLEEFMQRVVICSDLCFTRSALAAMVRWPGRGFPAAAAQPQEAATPSGGRLVETERSG